jgi:outer membrane lipoprotein-sorting protein
MKKYNNTLMKKTILCCLLLVGMTTLGHGQEDGAKALLDQVSTKMGAYSNMTIAFSSSLTNEDAGIQEGDEPPIKGVISLEREKYNLEYLGNTFIFDGSKLYVINHEEQEISINDGDLDADDGFIYPSKLLTFYKEGYSFALGKVTEKGTKKTQTVILTPMDSHSEIVQVVLAIDLRTKHIVNLIQTGANSSKTSFKITSLKYNQVLPETMFSFDKEAYVKKDYIID